MCEYLQDGRRSAVRAARVDLKSMQRGSGVPMPQMKVVNASLGFSETSSREQCTQYAAQHPIYIQASPEMSHVEVEGSDDIGNSEPSLSPTEADFTGATVESGHTHVYGVTSTLHHRTSVGKAAGMALVSQQEKKTLKSVAQDRLISYAAIQRQQESAIFATPDIMANIDFDGIPAESALHLLDLHWNRQHLSYLITYRPAIMDSIFNGGPYANKLLLNALYFSSSLYSDRIIFRSDLEDPQTTGLSFYNRCKQLLVLYIDEPTIPTMTALLLYGASLVALGKHSAGWIFCGIAYRMMSDLGCHLEATTHNQSPATARLGAVDVEIRRRVYWGAYVNDKFQSLFLGRAPVLHLSEARVPKEYLDSYEEMEEWKPYLDPASRSFTPSRPTYRGRPSFAVSTFKSLLELAEIAATIIESFYSISSVKASPSLLERAKSEITTKLWRWRNNLPTHLDFDPERDPTPPPHQITPQ